MALRDQPYIPLYIQDVLTDEKLIECSAEAHGIYLRLLCILHKQEIYGKICLKQKYRQGKNKRSNFSSMLVKQMPFTEDQIGLCIQELHDEGVIHMTESELVQKRMYKDGKLSIMRSEFGKDGGSKSRATKQYGKQGLLYLMSDGLELSKIGISINPKNRLYRIRSDYKLKMFEIIETIEVDDMGKSEDFALEYFGDWMDGEWIRNRPSLEVKEKFVLLTPKLQANAESESESEDRFKKWWELYGKKTGKKKSEHKFNSFSKKVQDAIIVHTPKYIAVTNTDGTFPSRKDPYTYLNSEIWLDEELPGPQKPNTRADDNQDHGTSL